MVWQDAIERLPIAVLCRNIFLWLDFNGYLEMKEEIKEFVDVVFMLRDISPEKAAMLLAKSWDNSVAKCLKD
jgi:hypothetical protein